MRRLAASVATLFISVSLGSCTREETKTPTTRGIDILVISDSNGVGESSWPALMGSILSQARGDHPVRILNESLAGRTLAIERGFAGSAASISIEHWIEDAINRSDGNLEIVLICLGTNDVQARFADGTFASESYLLSIRSLLERASAAAPESRLVVVTPPPICRGSDEPDSSSNGPQSYRDPRWRGAYVRMLLLTKVLREAAQILGIDLIEMSPPADLDPCEMVGADGVHLNARGQQAVAEAIAQSLSPTVSRL